MAKDLNKSLSPPKASKQKMESTMMSSPSLSPVNLEISHHPLTMRRVVNLVIAMERMKSSVARSLLSPDFRDEHLLSFMLESIIEERIVSELFATQSQFTRLPESEPKPFYSVTDSQKRTIVLADRSMKLHAVMLQGGSDFRKVHLNMSTYRPPTSQAPLPSAQGRPVALGIKGTQYYLSCHMEGSEASLHVETVSSSDLLSSISTNSDMMRFIFYKHDTGRTPVSSLRSACYPEWYISTTDVNNDVQMCREASSHSTFCFHHQSVQDKENKIPSLSRDFKAKTVQATSVKQPLGPKNTNISKNNTRGSTTVKVKNQKAPVFTKTYTIRHSKSAIPAVSQLPITNAHSVRKASSKTSDSQSVKVPSTRTTLCPNTSSVSKSNAENGRMIHGPIIKTRTGLMPAVIQPKKSNSLSHRPQASIRSLRKTMSTIAPKPLSEKTATMTTKEDYKAQNKCRPSTATTKNVQRQSSTLSNRLRTLSQMTSKPLGQIRRQKILRQISWKTPASMTANRDTYKVNKVAAAACNQGGKNKLSKEIQNKKTAPLSKPGQGPVAPKEKKRPIVPQTAPQPSRVQNLTSKSTGTKTPEGRAALQPATKPLTAAQDRIKKLQEWRASKGISYKRPPMFVKTQARRTIAVPQPFWSDMREEDEAHSLICAVDRSLADCIKLLGEGCPTDQVKDVLSRLPAVSQKFAKYWICQARLMEQEGNLDVLPMFEKAVGLVVEPVDELRTVVFEILKKRDDNQDGYKQTEESPEKLNDPVMTPKPTRALICAEKGSSSVVKYKITATPGGPPSQRRESTVVNGQEVRFFTPVRRSVRIEKSALRYPVSLQDHDLCVASYNDLMAEEENESAQQNQSEGSSAAHSSPMYIYRENDALKDKVMVEYVCNDE
ncbi:hypothetical protein WMY93_004430 [Mugilogobius chulae]|uniref:Interleukin-1 n=1 Tax=Mugilogobius chulae TaxID=88201 RepID=A0AAW0PP02_9GOBI